MKHLYVCFPQGRNKAVTLSYDDGRIEDRKFVSILNQNGLKGTFHLNFGYLNGKDKGEEERYGKRVCEEEIAQLYQGHEVACHSLFHPTLTRCPGVFVAEQILSDRRGLEAIVGEPICGFSYPNGAVNQELKRILKDLGIVYGRVVGNTEDFDMPDDFMEWKATCHHNHHLLELTEQFLNKERNQHLNLFYVWGHSYEFSRDDNWELIEKFAEKIGGREDIWYATNLEIYQYMKAFQSLIFTADSSKVYNPSVQPVWLRVDEKLVEARPGVLTVLS
ncbi:MAG: polysaccharide deacetylase family protein [Faecalimonas umbilicata]|uniref:polysaccharide deacetylase family protein n=1 Tax=Faecalimonas umbilicata TaxID=1912855 RepID=UPI001DB8CE6B|nr:polysaccharide deacetylase family protein [Faecalimonas umbilicata]MBS5764236.1 polysaccharide deacetylase family protein [Lachnospiraceae bacterium]MCI5986171.1 polysaccharide deacetylase family protein [Faecalimonas umbilicata]MDY5092272.1 polysaccharide deacetylase family protein [Faecalimonas umbilicata]